MTCTGARLLGLWTEHNPVRGEGLLRSTSLSAALIEAMSGETWVRPRESEGLIVGFSLPIDESDTSRPTYLGGRSGAAYACLMQRRNFGRLGTVSALTLGGGGIGQVWGTTSREEAIATLHEAVDGGITLLDMAPLYGNGEAETVVGEAFRGALPPGLRITTKHFLGNPPPNEVYERLSHSLHESLARMQLKRVDLFILHGMIAAEARDGATTRTSRALYKSAVVPAFERLISEGSIGAWGITGVGEPGAVIETLEDDPAPFATQCITNLLDSRGSMARFEGESRAREIIATASNRGVGVLGIRAVQAGALTDRLDRELPEDHPEMRDYQRAAGFRTFAHTQGVSPAFLAHRYALSMDDVDTVVLGVKNRAELRECLAAEAAGPLRASTIAAIDASAARAD